MLHTSSPEFLIHKLCEVLCGSDADPEAIKQTALYSFRMLSHCGQHTVPNIDETGLIEKIKLQLTKTGKMDDAVKVSVLHRRLKQCEFLQNRWSILYLLHALSSKKNPKQQFGSGSLLFRQGLASSSTPAANLPGGRISQHSLTSSSGFGTAVPASSRGGDRTVSQLPSEIRTPLDNTRSDFSSMNLSSRLAWTKTPASLNSQQSSRQNRTASITQIPLENITNNATRGHSVSTSRERVSEGSLVRQLLYVFQGIETKNIKHSTRENAFCLSSELDVDKREKQTVHRLAELGWLHNKVKKYVDTHNKDKAFGLVGQSFCAALQQELTEYYRLLSVLQSQIHQVDSGFEDDCSLTLSKLVVWTYEPMERLRWIATLVDNCQGKKGGALASMVHSYMQTGDENSRAITTRILNVVSQPIFYIVDRWIYDGELHDPFHEFFVASDQGVSNERLWYDKYRMRTAMIPSFVKMEQAQKILLVGKSINFLRLVCKDRSPINNKDKRLTQTEKAKADKQGYGVDFASDLKVRVDRAYEATSSHLLQVLNDRYKMLTHLHALRKFLLLGQGDFIRHLLDFLQDELDKPASTLYRHNLSGPVEAAVRASNAQFEDQDVLARLDFRLLEINPGDFGWDVFSLDYHVDAPLDTLITPDVMLVYLRIFIFLWRAKRMEYQLSLIWTSSMEQTRSLAPNLKHLQGVLHHCHTLAAEMVHFVHQMQYYIAFEVLECSWADLQTKLEESKDFDEVIDAHHTFLQSLMKRCLLDQSSSNLLMQLRTIFDQIVKFEHLQKDIYEQSCSELRARQRYDRELDEAEQKGVWGADSEKEEEEMMRRKSFKKITIPEMRARLKVCTCSYQDMVVMFLRQLDQESDTNLRNLSWRLDFNEHYRSRNTALQVGKPRTGKQR